MKKNLFLPILTLTIISSLSISVPIFAKTLDATHEKNLVTELTDADITYSTAAHNQLDSVSSKRKKSKEFPWCLVLIIVLSEIFIFWWFLPEERSH